LDDVFFTLTGDHIEEDGAGDDPSLDGSGRAAELEGANA
jgi:hypothetical protein